MLSKRCTTALTGRSHDQTRSCVRATKRRNSKGERLRKGSGGRQVGRTGRALSDRSMVLQRGGQYGQKGAEG
eukprot:3935113-Rhodomonas_salina.4